MDVLTVREAVKWAADRTRDGKVRHLFLETGNLLGLKTHTFLYDMGYGFLERVCITKVLDVYFS